jgi:tetratricopeptide (TPR) repeat protein
MRFIFNRAFDIWPGYAAVLMQIRILGTDRRQLMDYRVHKRNIIFLILVLLVTGCLMSGGAGEKKKKGDQLLFSQAQKAFDARDYVDAIGLFELFAEKYPRSEAYTWALQRLGESFEGLLETEYQHRIEAGEPEQEVTEQFLSKYGHYKCWKESAGGLAYNKTHYQTILEKFPDSPIADEAAYKTIPWQKDYKGRPEAPLKELSCLEKVLEKYPTTSYRCEILFKMASRCHILYEIHSFSLLPGIRDRDKAEQYRSKAIYLYKLTLKSPDHTKYSQKAWRGLRMLEERQGRIYILQ